MTLRLSILAAVLALSTLAHAQEEPAAAPAPASAPSTPAEEPSWQVGAGLSFGYTLSVLGPAAESILVGPSAMVEAEHRLAPATWLRFGLIGGYFDGRPLVVDDDEAKIGNIAALVGVRRIFTPGAPVELSAFGDLVLGYQHLETRGSEADMFDFRVQAGVAVERELVERLSLRLSLGLLDAGVQVRDTPRGDADTGFNANIVFRPALTLQFLF